MVQITQSFRQIRSMRCIIPNVLLVVCIALDELMMVDVLRGVPARPYIVWGTWLHGNPSPTLFKESFLMTIR